jgi:hypothetical protein
MNSALRCVWPVAPFDEEVIDLSFFGVSFTKPMVPKI